jgi:hypothetical protein
MAVLGLWDILLPWMHRPPHLLHLPLLYMTKMCHVTQLLYQPTTHHIKHRLGIHEVLLDTTIG